MATMTDSEMRDFLAEPHVIALAVERAMKPPLIVPMWYGITPGGNVFFCTDDDTLKTRAIRHAGRVSLLAQHVTQPYAYVGIEGTASGSPASEDDVRALSARYLDPESLEQYVAAT
jgi:nitroimidazol reductase NimA-like FMN-containing flavoprotein (pyridoxamine 5'-phosphate oxidase superfamily)